MFDEIKKKTEELCELLSGCEDYVSYKAARDRAMQNETTKALLKQFNELRMKAQANMVLGHEDKELTENMKKIEEILSMNADAVQYLVCEYRVTALMGYVYQTLSEAVKLDGVVPEE
ncbi:MAG: YlbF family regulator [Eubacteriales bacterium]|nr:YlbF family regulator [Eubacteriales bacterium]